MSWRLLAIAVAVTLIGGACNDATTPRAEAVDLIQQNRYAEATIVLDELLLAAPDDQELHYLAGIAAFGEAVDQINFLTTLILAIVFGDFDAVQGGLDDAAADENEFILHLIDRVIAYLAEPARRAATHLEQVRDPNIRLKFDDFQLRFWQTDFLELSGTWDAADAAFLQALIEPWAAVLDIADAHDFRTDVYLAVHEILGPDPAETLPAYANVGVQLLLSETYPNFLGLAADGADLMSGARGRLGNFATRWLQFIDLASARANVELGIFQLAMSDNDVRVLRLANRVRMTPDAKLDLSFRVVPDSTFQTLDIDMPESFSQALAGIEANMTQAAPAPRLTVEQHVLPLIVPVAFSLLRHVTISDTVEAVLDLIGDDADAASDFIGDFLPDGLELDVAAWLESGQGIRSLLPLYRSDLAQDQNNFLLEWECPGFFAPSVSAPVGSTAVFPGDSLTCPDQEDADFSDRPEDDFDLIDSGHFYAQAFTDANVVAIAADGTRTSWPIIAFADASFAGMVYIDADRFADVSDASGPVPADNGLLNAWLAELYASLGSFL